MKNIDMNQVNVPSLYVRVYRMPAINAAVRHCSLTIREGVSIERIQIRTA